LSGFCCHWCWFAHLTEASTLLGLGLARAFTHLSPSVRLVLLVRLLMSILVPVSCNVEMDCGIFFPTGLLH
jgi:hypothetical protein